jgi:P-type E1-E2 ATPase
LNIRIGDLLRVEKDGNFPVDMLLVLTPNKDGLVFVDTANLDGETNLKDKS